MRESAVNVPELVRLNAVEVDDLRVPRPFGIVLEKICEEVVAVVGNHGHCVGLANRECVHHDFVRVVVGAVGNRAVEMREVVCNLFGENLESASLHGKHAGVDPVPLWLHGLGKAKKFRLRFTGIETALFNHELVRVNQADIRDKQGRQVNFRDEQSIEVDVYNCAGFAFEYGKEFRKHCSDAWSVVNASQISFEN